MSRYDQDEVEGYLKAGLAALEAAEVPEHLQEIAYATALSLLCQKIERQQVLLGGRPALGG